MAKEANNSAAIPPGANAVAEPAPPPPDGSPPQNAAAPKLPEPSGLGTQIPAFLQGRWGLSPADCTSTRGDAKGLLVITDREIRFYESRAVPARNTAATDDSFSADFTFSGEGQSWTSFQTLQLQDKKLVRTTSSPMASYSYAKCS